MKCFVIGGGACDDNLIMNLTSTVSLGDRAIIACDKGAKVCLRLGLPIDLAIGDFDSAGEDLYLDLVNKGIKTKKLNPVKDDTDSEAALNYAIDNYEGDIYFFGSTGSRLDHVLGNIALLGLGVKRGRRIFLMDPTNKISMLGPGDSVTIKKTEQYGRYVSVIPYMGKVEGLCMKGFKYPLENSLVEGFNTLTISNEILADEAEISLKDGYLVVLETRD